MMILANRSIFLAVLVTVSFPIILLLEGNWQAAAVAAIASALLLWVHRKNFGRVKRGEEAPMRELLKTAVFKIRK